MYTKIFVTVLEKNKQNEKRVEIWKIFFFSLQTRWKTDQVLPFLKTQEINHEQGECNKLSILITHPKLRTTRAKLLQSGGGLLERRKG